MNHPPIDPDVAERQRLIFSLDSVIHELQSCRMREDFDSLWASAMDITRIASLLSKPEEEM